MKILEGKEDEDSIYRKTGLLKLAVPTVQYEYSAVVEVRVNAGDVELAGHSGEP